MPYVTITSGCTICGGDRRIWAADVENGPSSSDAYETEAICEGCDADTWAAYYDSQCLTHRVPMGDCVSCTVKEEG